MTAADGVGSASTNRPGLTGLTKDVGDAIVKKAGCYVSTTSVKPKSRSNFTHFEIKLERLFGFTLVVLT